MVINRNRFFKTDRFPYTKQARSTPSVIYSWPPKLKITIEIPNDFTHQLYGRQNAAIVTYNCSWNSFTVGKSCDNHPTHLYTKHKVYTIINSSKTLDKCSEICRYH